MLRLHDKTTSLLICRRGLKAAIGGVILADRIEEIVDGDLFVLGFCLRRSWATAQVLIKVSKSGFKNAQT
jgi:hypothetical protein